MQNQLLTSYLGLSMTSSFLMRKEGTLSYALNANIQTLSGERLSYTNELSNQLCTTFPEGFDVIGFRNILAKNETIFALVNAGSGQSKIVRVKNYDCNNLTVENVEKNCNCIAGKKLISTVEELMPCCEQVVITEAECLGFNINYPVKITYKITNCGYRIYFSDDLNNDRYLDVDDPNGVDGCNEPYTTLDCNRINIFKEFCLPEIKVEEVTSGGNLTAGIYLASLVYTDSIGSELTDAITFTNPTPIFDRKITVDTDYITGQAIRYKIKHNTDLYTHFKLIIQKVVNSVPEFIETDVYTVKNNNTIVFTNNDATLVKSSREKVFTRRPYYTKSNFIEESGDHLLLADLEGDPEYNLQPIANRLELFWETVNMPNDKENNYSNPLVATIFRTYQRDEVYPFAVRFKLKNGKKTKAYHIPGRNKILDSLPFNDDTIVATNNNDNVQDSLSCKDPENKQFWEVYNTASKIINKLPEIESDDKICDITRGERGVFAYWESTELYPCNEEIWGDLAGKPIRFHKFPDSQVTHHHDDLGNTLIGKNTIKPIGVRINVDVFNSLLNTVSIYNPKTDAEDLALSDLICGVELVRGNRVGNKSIIAKGILYDVGQITEKDGDNTVRSYYFPNYPYNDTFNNDPYISKDRRIYDTPEIGYGPESYLQHSYDDRYRARYTFHSPDTHFQSPQLGNILKLEALLKGKQEGHFVEVQDHPRYKFLNRTSIDTSLIVGSISGLKITGENQTVATPPAAMGSAGKLTLEVNYADVINTTNQVKDVIENLIPRKNFAYQYNSRGYYSGFTAIPNHTINAYNGELGIKIRSLDIAKYLSPNVLNIGDDMPFNNYQRESSVYFKANKYFKDYDSQEFSRFTLSSASAPGTFPTYFSINPDNWCSKPNTINSTDIRSYYASNKRYIPDQYGNIENVKWVTTGYEITIEDNRLNETYYPAFGGDTFINLFSLKRKMPFFTGNMVGRPDEIAFDYNLFPNVGFPRYYMGTSSDELEAKEVLTDATIGLILGGLSGLLLTGSAPIAGIGITTLAQTAITGALASVYRGILQSHLSKNNFDCTIEDKGLFYQSGKFYLASYGIPQFFVESDINLDLRHGVNEKEGNFYGSDDSGIPDDWLQEKNVPIARDNTYNYNPTYSVQNSQEYIETFNNDRYKKDCQSDFPNRIIYSEKANREENKDNWLVFPIAHYYDFDKSYGKIVGIHGIDNEKLLIRFENGIQIWNTTITLQSNSPQEVQLQGSGIFGSTPLEFSKTNIGHGGSQHIAFEKTKVGMFYADAKRGHIFRFTGNSSPDEISKTEYNWFKENLPFNIIKDFPEYNIDNAFKDIGLILCWDEKFERLFVTKKDYKLIPSKKAEVLYNTLTKTFFRIDNSGDIPLIITIPLDDANYFENRSWTMAWSPIVNNWISFYSFLPNYYVSLPNHFQTGIKSMDITGASLWNHNLSNLSHQVYYNTLYPYIVEYPIKSSPGLDKGGNLVKSPNNKLLQSLSVNCDILKYVTERDFYSLKSVNTENYNIFFNKAILYNKEQCSGLLELTEVPINNLREKLKYPIYNRNSISILYSKYAQEFTLNSFYDITNNYNNGQPIFSTDWDDIKDQYPIDKALNIDNTNYRNNMKKVNIKSTECYIRLIQDKNHRYKFINHFSTI
jgi:hypothetical protein